MKKTVRREAAFWIFLTGILLFLAVVYFFDNKYIRNTPMPQDDILFLSENDLAQDEPIFLIDAWQICEGTCTPTSLQNTTRTWIGEFSNYQRGNDLRKAPLGSATYQLSLQYIGEDTLVRLYFPDLCQSYSLWWDDTLLVSGHTCAQTALLLTKGTHAITLSVTAKSGYYAGMYFPGAIGSDRAITSMIGIQTAAYGIAFLVPLLLALFCFHLWARIRDSLRFRFGLLCLSFAFSLCRYFLALWPNALSAYRFLLSDLALYAMVYFALTLTWQVTKVKKRWFYRPLFVLSCGLPAVEILLYFLVPIWGSAPFVHGLLQNAYRIFAFVCLVLGGVSIGRQEDAASRRILCANGALGLSLLGNLTASNQFEPAYLLWQYEWCGLIMVILFAALLEAENCEILKENQAYQAHLEELVAKRTKQLSCVLDERRAFFFDMAHDLKAPLFALKAFTHLIRLHDVELDNEMLFYLDQIEQQQAEMSQRVDSLNTLNTVDSLKDSPKQIFVSMLLPQLYHRHNPEAAASGIYMKIEPFSGPAAIFISEKKLSLVFENLFYNALRFTPREGTITLRAHTDENTVHIAVCDTGCGILPEELPHIFERFYMGEAGKVSGGSGLGLYISQMILQEMGGSLQAESEVGVGSIFTVILPIASSASSGG